MGRGDRVDPVALSDKLNDAMVGMVQDLSGLIRQVDLEKFLADASFSPEQKDKFVDGLSKLADTFNNRPLERITNNLKEWKTSASEFATSGKELFTGRTKKEVEAFKAAAKKMIRNNVIKYGLIAGGVATAGIILISVLCAAATYPILKSAIKNGTAAGNRISPGAPGAAPLVYTLPPAYGSAAKSSSNNSQYG